MRNKRSVFMVLILFICITGLFGAVCGDVDNSGSVTISDALLIAKYFIGSINTLTEPRNADVNSDNTINIIDALLVAKFYIGLISELNCPPEPTPLPSGTVTISRSSGIQCETIYYNNATEAIQDLQSHGITVLRMEVQSLIVVALCGIPTGVTYIALIYESDLEKARAIGWS